MNKETISDGFATSVRDLVPTTISWTWLLGTYSRGDVSVEKTYILLGSGELDYSFFDRTAAIRQL
jgi:hypothetical protein